MLSAAEVLAWTSERLAKGADSEALAALAEAVVRFPDDAALAVRHADALQLGGQLTAAAAEYRRALLLDPVTADGWNGLGCAELARGAYGETVRCLRRAWPCSRSGLTPASILGRRCSSWARSMRRSIAIAPSSRPVPRR